MQLAQRLRRLFTSPAITFDDDVELMKAGVLLLHALERRARVGGVR
jgi:hypothetical protein